MNNITEKLERILKKDHILIDEPMSKHTSFKIGGKADYFLKIENEDELKKVLKLANDEKIPFFIIGNGTNILVREGGIRGFVIKLEFKEYSVGTEVDFAYITAGSGVTLGKLAIVALENGLTGLENMSGIPGTVGGAIRMNAGSYGREMKDLVVFSKCIDKNGKIYELNLQEHKFEYRKSAFEDNNLIILETTLKLEFANKDKIKEKMEDFKKSRQQNQPLEYPNAGSIFKRNPDFPAAKLIDDCGLKGYRIGDAEISTKHAGFIVNKGNAKASDVLALINHITKEIKEKFDKDIKLEIIVIGEK